jgi:hypothetical protein
MCGYLFLGETAEKLGLAVKMEKVVCKKKCCFARTRTVGICFRRKIFANLDYRGRGRLPKDVEFPPGTGSCCRAR